MVVYGNNTIKAFSFKNLWERRKNRDEKKKNKEKTRK
jgi:hypothetical protein